VIATAAALAVGTLVVPAANADTTFRLMVSSSVSRSDAVKLSSQRLEGKVAIFTTAVANTTAVDFYLDDEFMRGAPLLTETSAPYDFARTNTDGNAILFDVSSLSPGRHMISAERWVKGGSVRDIEATFVVGKGSSIPAPSGGTTTSTTSTTTKPTTTSTTIKPTTTTVPTTTIPPTTVPPVPSGSLSVRISGNRFIDSNGNTVRLLGANRSGTQYTCMDGDGIFDGPSDDASIAAMKAWGMTAIRVNGNEDCWLGINGVKAAFGGANYQAAIGDFVKRINAQGMYVIFDLHHSAPGTQKALDMAAMADRDHSVDYWKSVSAYFKNNPAVVFDLYNEPYPDNNRDSVAAWTCVRDGGSCAGVGFTAAGMQELVNAVRSSGATNPIMVGGPQYSGTLSRWLEYKPNDPLNQIAASVHIYGQPLGSPYDQASTWNGDLVKVSAQVPVVMGEIGDSDCTHKFVDQLMPWADAHGISYLAWGWVTSACAGEPALITNYNGTPTAYGVGVRDHLQALKKN
jgi:endoglucanase